MKNDVVELLENLIRIPSPNPPGDCSQIAGFIADWLADSGAGIQILSPLEKPEAKSVVATLGRGHAPVIMLHAHTDTVPVATAEAQAWSHDPYTPTIVGKRLYGKGSIDDKAALAAMMTVFRSIAERHDARYGTLVLVAVADEEVGGQLGTRWLVNAGHLPASDFIIVGEQTGNRAALAHKGVMRATITTRGRAVHATNPDRGVNAITAMARILLALERYHASLRSRNHPLVGMPTCNVGTIQGGSTVNAVPDICTIGLDRRMIPREDPDAVKEELKEVVAAVNVSPAVAEIGDFLFSSWFDSPLNTALGRTFLTAIQNVTGCHPGPVGYLPGSDAKHLMTLARGDIVIFGPGSYEVAHSSNEHVELEALKDCEAILASFLNTVFSSNDY